MTNPISSINSLKPTIYNNTEQPKETNSQLDPLFREKIQDLEKKMKEFDQRTQVLEEKNNELIKQITNISEQAKKYEMLISKLVTCSSESYANQLNLIKGFFETLTYQINQLSKSIEKNQEKIDHLIPDNPKASSS